MCSLANSVYKLVLSPAQGSWQCTYWQGRGGALSFMKVAGLRSAHMSWVASSVYRPVLSTPGIRFMTIQVLARERRGAIFGESLCWLAQHTCGTHLHDCSQCLHTSSVNSVILLDPHRWRYQAHQNSKYWRRKAGRLALEGRVSKALST